MSAPTNIAHTMFSTVDHASLYSKFRPNLPQKVMDYIVGQLKKGIDQNQWKLAVDVGCGGGQSCHVLAEHFKLVKGFDVSKSQINEAVNSVHPNNVHFEVSMAEDLPSIEPNSVQLMIASSAVHWFDLKKFFPEVRRVLAPNGVLALIAYVMCEVIDPDFPDDTRLTDMMLDLRRDPFNTLNQYRLSNIERADTRYTDIKFPDYFEYFYQDNIINEINITGEDIIGFIQSWSPYQQMFKSDESKAKLFLTQIEEKFKTILKTNNLKEKQLLCHYHYFVAGGRKID